MGSIVSVMVQPSRQATLGVSGQTSSHTVRRTVPAEGGETGQVVVAFQAVKSQGLRRLSGDVLAGGPRRRDAWIARRSPAIAPYSVPNSAFDSASRPLRVDDFGPDLRHGGLGRGSIRGVADGPDRGSRRLTVMHRYRRRSSPFGLRGRTAE
jgi:hypothetical protein